MARYAPDEPQHAEAKRILNKIEVGKLAAVTSVLTLVEVVCTTSRAYQRFDDQTDSMDREEIAGAFLKKIINIKGLDFIPTGGTASLLMLRKDK